MVVAANVNLSITVQCRLLSISRSSWYYNLKGESLLNLKLMRRQKKYPKYEQTLKVTA